SRGLRRVAPPAERPAARRRRGLARGHPDCHGVRPEPARPLAHEARGLEAGAPRAGSARARRAHVEDARVSRQLLTKPRARTSVTQVLVRFEPDAWSGGDAEREPGTHLGRRCVVARGFAPVLADVELEHGTIELELAVGAERAFHGVTWRARDVENYESF